MDGGAFAEAIAGYRSSYELTRDPALLYNIGSAYERLGDYPRALAYLEQFALVAPIALRSRVPALDEIIASVRSHLARVAVGCNVPGARILVRGAWKGTTPLEVSIAALPGLARVEVVADGYQPFARDVVLSAGKETRLDAVLFTNDALTGVKREPSGGDGDLTKQWWFWTGVGVVLAAGAAVSVVAVANHHTSSSGEPSEVRASTPLIAW
jgi:tetratricopeptide (TPR) repeat protein